MIINSATWTERYNYEVVDQVVDQIESLVKKINVPQGIGIDITVSHNNYYSSFEIRGSIATGSTWNASPELKVRATDSIYDCINVPSYDIELSIMNSNLQLFRIMVPYDATDDSSVQSDIQDLSNSIRENINKLNKKIIDEFNESIQAESEKRERLSRLDQRRSELNNDVSWIDSAIRNAVQKSVDDSDGLGFIDGDIYGYCIDEIAYTGDLAKGIRKAKKIASADPAIWEDDPIGLLEEAGQHKMLTSLSAIKRLFDSHGVQLPDWYFD